MKKAGIIKSPAWKKGFLNFLRQMFIVWKFKKCFAKKHPNFITDFIFFTYYNNSQEKTNARLAKQDHQNSALPLLPRPPVNLKPPAAQLRYCHSAGKSSAQWNESKEWKGINVLFFLTSAFSGKKLAVYDTVFQCFRVSSFRFWWNEPSWEIT